MNKSLTILKQKEDFRGELICDLLMLHYVCWKTFMCFHPAWAWDWGLHIMRIAESHSFWHLLDLVTELAVCLYVYKQLFCNLSEFVFFIYEVVRLQIAGQILA